MNHSSFIDIAGIVLDRAGLEPLAGVRVSERTSRQQQTTDANGFYSMQVPIGGNDPQIVFDFARPGYFPFKKGIGLSSRVPVKAKVLIDVLYPETLGLNEEYLNSIPKISPTAPGYLDALAEMEKVREDHWTTIRFREMQKARPEISLFYVSRDGFRRFVLYRDGRVEAYGGPGEPGFSDLDARYTPLPGYMLNLHKESPRKPSSWQNISQRVQQDFHPASGDAKAILFPGDSNIIVINADGEAEIYEMIDMEGTQRGRSDFEARYGKLPDYIPVAVKRPGEDCYDIRHEIIDGVGSHEIRARQSVKRTRLTQIDSEPNPESDNLKP